MAAAPGNPEPLVDAGVNEAIARVDGGAWDRWREKIARGGIQDRIVFILDLSNIFGWDGSEEYGLCFGRMFKKYLHYLSEEDKYRVVVYSVSGRANSVRNQAYMRKCFDIVGLVWNEKYIGLSDEPPCDRYVDYECQCADHWNCPEGSHDLIENVYVELPFVNERGAAVREEVLLCEDFQILRLIREFSSQMPKKLVLVSGDGNPGANPLFQGRQVASREAYGRSMVEAMVKAAARLGGASAMVVGFKGHLSEGHRSCQHYLCLELPKLRDICRAHILGQCKQVVGCSRAHDEEAEEVMKWRSSFWPRPRRYRWDAGSVRSWFLRSRKEFQGGLELAIEHKKRGGEVGCFSCAKGEQPCRFGRWCPLVRE